VRRLKLIQSALITGLSVVPTTTDGAGVAEGFLLAPWTAGITIKVTALARRKILVGLFFMVQSC
jgi:hypothetical protein